MGRGEGEGRRGEGVNTAIVVENSQSQIECDVCSGRGPTKRSRENLLGSLVDGDVFTTDGLLFVVVAIEPGLIRARRLIVHEERTFSRTTGQDITIDDADGRRSAITSVEPLPPDVHNTILWLDRKNRLLTDMSKAKLTEAEKNALLFVSDHHVANPI